MMKWKNLMMAGLMVFAGAILADIIMNIVTPAQVSTIAVQQATDTTGAQVATRATNESIAAFNLVCDVVKFVGLMMVGVGMVMLMKLLSEKPSTETQGGEGRPSESKADDPNRNK